VGSGTSVAGCVCGGGWGGWGGGEVQVVEGVGSDGASSSFGSPQPPGAFHEEMLEGLDLVAAKDTVDRAGSPSAAVGDRSRENDAGASKESRVGCAVL